MALDGIMFEGVTVRVRRPNDYNPSAAAALGPSVPSPSLDLQAIGLQVSKPPSPPPPGLRPCPYKLFNRLCWHINELDGLYGIYGTSC